MNKRGQVFLLAAVIIVALIVLVTMSYNTYFEEISLEEFEKLSENYNTEAPKVINDAIEDDTKNEVEAIESFTKQFIEDYANEQDPNFGLVYFYKDSKGDVHIYNSLSQKEIKIEYLTDEFDATKTSISLLGSDTQTEGEVCMDVGGFMQCIQTETDVGNFGEGFYKTSIEDVESLCIKIEGISDQCIQISLGGFKSTTLTELETTGKGELDNITYEQPVKIHWPEIKED